MKRKGQDVQAWVALAGQGCAPWYRKCDDIGCSSSDSSVCARSCCCCGSGGTCCDSGRCGCAARGFEGEDEHGEVGTGAEHTSCGSEDIVDDRGGLCGAGRKGDMS
jgi:hypothetical protein